MHIVRPLKFGILLFAAIIPSSSCFVRKRIGKLPADRVNAPTLTARKDELIERIHRIADPLRSFRMQMDMSPSVGSVYSGEIKDYATLGGYILFRAPDSIRVLGLDPVLGSTIVDMVSVGELFRIHIPRKNRFIEGRNDAPPTSNKPLENLRPLALLTSLIVEPRTPAQK